MSGCGLGSVGTGTVVGSCECGNEPSSSIKTRNFLKAKRLAFQELCTVELVKVFKTGSTSRNERVLPFPYRVRDITGSDLILPTYSVMFLVIENNKGEQFHESVTLETRANDSVQHCSQSSHTWHRPLLCDSVSVVVVRLKQGLMTSNLRWVSTEHIGRRTKYNAMNTCKEYGVCVHSSSIAVDWLPFLLHNR
jgi:hypothetical protein